jgi:hypothetical protein
MLGGQHPGSNTLMMHRELQIISSADILAFGLACVSYDTKRQIWVNLNRNLTRSKQFFGLDSPTTTALFKNMRSKDPNFKLKDGLFMLNWLYLNDKQSVLGGRWGYCEEYIGKQSKAMHK